MTKTDWAESLKKWVEANPVPEGECYFDLRDQFERNVIGAALKEHGNNTNAARALKVGRTMIIEAKRRLGM